MDNRSWPLAVSDDGLRGRILDAPDGRGGAVRVELADGRTIEVPVSALGRQADGSYRIGMPLRGPGAEADASGMHRERHDAEMVIPVIEETATVQKRLVETGRTHVRKHVETRTETVDEPLLRQEVKIEHVPIGRLVEGPAPQQRYEGDTLVVPILEEVLVVEKRLRLREELRISRVQTAVHEPQTVVLRSESVTVDRVSPSADSEAGDARNL